MRPIPESVSRALDTYAELHFLREEIFDLFHRGVVSRDVLDWSIHLRPLGRATVYEANARIADDYRLTLDQLDEMMDRIG